MSPRSSQDAGERFARIVRLDPTVVNRIAAGEVVERPASVAKELIENALDAEATRIEVATAGGGRTLLRVTDNGSGIAADDLPLALERHATSKLDHDLMDVRTMGFRGEALPSIGSVARLTLRSRARGAASGAELRMVAGRMEPPSPAPANEGTIAEVRDLFHATPARLKFLRTERAEAAAVLDVVRRAALANPRVHFTLSGEDRRASDWPAARGDDPVDALRRRIAQVLGEEFAADTVPIEAEREGALLTGFAGLPAHNRGNALHQFVFVNGRPVRDKQLLGALRGAYGDLVPKGRHPVAVLFLDCPPGMVDANVHPQKAEVRFRDPGLVKGLMVGAIREALAEVGARRGTAKLADGLLQSFRARADVPEAGHRGPMGGIGEREIPTRPRATSAVLPAPRIDAPVGGFGEAAQAAFSHPADPADALDASPRKADEAWASFPATSPKASTTMAEPSARVEATDEANAHHPLGAARAQLHECYIVAQTRDGIVLVDQHAAHERLVMEALKRGTRGRKVPAQLLLLPQIVSLPPEAVEALTSRADELASLALEIETFGPDAVAVRAVPAMLGEVDAGAIVRDLADEMEEWGTADTLAGRLDKVVATIACHGSVRAGRRLDVAEMNALLREIERTPGAEVCNHGRPTFVELDLKDVERLFGR